MALASAVEDKWFLLSMSFKSHEYLARPLTPPISPPLCVNVDTVAPPTPPYIDQVSASSWAQQSSDTGHIKYIPYQASVTPKSSPVQTERYLLSAEKEADWAQIIVALLK